MGYQETKDEGLSPLNPKNRDKFKQVYYSYSENQAISGILLGVEELGVTRVLEIGRTQFALR